MAKQYVLSEVEKRCRLARITQDENLRREMALHDKNSAVRAAAIGCITDQELLYQTALSDPNPDVRGAAICHIDSHERLKELALREKNGNLQYTFLYDVKDVDVIAHYAKSAVFLLTREKAVMLLEDQQLMYEIFIKAESHGGINSEKWDWLATKALQRITDVRLLRKIACDTKRGERFRHFAMQCLNDGDALFEKLLMDDSEYIAAYAATKTKSQDALMKAVFYHPNYSVRCKAVFGLDEQGLIEVIKKHPEWEFRRMAAKGYRNMPQNIAMRLALEDPVRAVRIEAIYHLTNRAVLLFLTLNDPCDVIALIACERLKDIDDAEKWQIIEKAVSREPRMKVIRFCRNKDMLTFTLLHDPDEDIRARANERLKKEMYD